MAFSRVVAVGDGVTNQFTINFALDYLQQSDISCRVGTEVKGDGTPSYRTLKFLSTNLIEVQGPVPASGVKVIFDRTVNKTALMIDYHNGDQLDETNLMLSQKQLLMATHEALDGRFVQFNGDLDAAGFGIINVREPVLDTDVATKKYVLSQNGPAAAANAAASAAAAAASLVAVNTVADAKIISINAADASAAASAASALASKNAAAVSAAAAQATLTDLVLVPLGGTMIWWDDILPPGFYWANGQVISNANVSTPALLARWGNRFGGNGTTTMGLPDLREVVPIGKATMGGVAARNTSLWQYVTQSVLNTINNTVFGQAWHTLTTGQIPSHRHPGIIYDPGHAHSYTRAAGPLRNDGTSALTVMPNLIADTTSANYTGVVFTSGDGVNNATGVAGGDGAHNNVQPSTICNWIIRVG